MAVVRRLEATPGNETVVVPVSGFPLAVPFKNAGEEVKRLRAPR